LLRKGEHTVPLFDLKESIMKVEEILNDFKTKSIQLDKLDEYCDAINELQSQLKEKDELKDFCLWLTGCGYDFTQHEYFIKQRTELLKN